MALEDGNLQLLNDVAELELDHDLGSVVSLEYGPFGADGVTASTGTVVLEVSNSGLAWYALTVLPLTGAGVTSVAAVGIWSCDIRFFNRVRARMSVVGGAQGVRVYLNASRADRMLAELKYLAEHSPDDRTTQDWYSAYKKAYDFGSD